jgi:hypothetical protein
MKALASVILAVTIAVLGADGLGRAWGAPAAGQHVKGRAWGPRPAWGGPRVWWGYGWPAYAWGPRPWWGPAWYGYPAYPYTYYPYAYPPAVVAPPNPQTYIQQAPPAPAQPEPPSYWYYCAEPRSYYPYVRECPEGWMTVVPPSSSPAP